MDEDKLRNQIPIFRFLNKHKWRIVLPLLFFFPYWMIPYFFAKSVRPVQSYLFVTSTQNATPEALNQEVAKISDQLQSDDTMLELVKKYDLFAKGRRQGMPDDQLIWKLRSAMVVGPESTKPPGGVNVYVRIHLLDEEEQKSTALLAEIADRFKSQSDLRVTETVNAPLELPWWARIFAVTMILLPGMTCSLILIFLWEIPFLFYSKKTQEMVFDPIRLDWRDERLEAKMNGDIMGVVAVNIRYSFAFIGAMLSKSPIGELFEFVGKVAR